jgi:hypothetical protein
MKLTHIPNYKGNLRGVSLRGGDILSCEHKRLMWKEEGPVYSELNICKQLSFKE